MTAPLAFLDTETTGIHPGRRVWEVAIIRREPDGQTTQWVAQIADVDLSDADPYGLKVGRFYQRHGHYAAGLPDLDADFMNEAAAARVVEQMTRGAHLVGAVPNFDAEVLADMLRRYRLTPAWHYHLVDVEALAVGYLHGLAAAAGPKDHRPEPLQPPWRSDDLTTALGVEPAGPDERHTALGDALWAMRIYDAVTSPRSDR